MRNSDSVQKKLYIDIVDDDFGVFSLGCHFGGWRALFSMYSLDGVGMKFGLLRQWKRGPSFWRVVGHKIAKKMRYSRLSPYGFVSSDFELDRFFLRRFWRFSFRTFFFGSCEGSISPHGFV